MVVTEAGLEARHDVVPDATARGWSDYLTQSAGWPTAFWRHFPGETDNAEELASSTLEFQRRHPSAFLKISPAGTTFASAYGLRHEWRGDHLGRMTVVKRPIEKPADWEHVIHSGADRHVQDYLLDSARLVVDGVSGESVLQTLFNPLTVATQLAGTATVRDHIQAEPALMRQVLAALSQSLCDLIGQLTECGVSGIYLVTQTMADFAFSRAEYAVWGMHYDEQCIAAASVLPCNVLHAHGEGVFLQVAPLARNWALHYELTPGNPPLRDCLEHTGGAAFVGLASAYLARQASVDDRRAFLMALDQRVGHRPSVLTAGCCLPLDFPDSCLQAWREAASRAKRA